MTTGIDGCTASKPKTGRALSIKPLVAIANGTFITDKYRMRIDRRARRVFDQGLTPIPMCRGTTTVEQTGARQEHCTSADRADAPDSWGNPFQPAHRFRLSLVLLDRVAAGHEQRIDLSAYLAKGLIRSDAQPAIGH